MEILLSCQCKYTVMYMKSIALNAEIPARMMFMERVETDDIKEYVEGHEYDVHHVLNGWPEDLLPDIESKMVN